MVERSRTTDDNNPEPPIEKKIPAQQKLDNERMLRSQDRLHNMEFNRDVAAHNMIQGPQSPGSKDEVESQQAEPVAAGPSKKKSSPEQDGQVEQPGNAGVKEEVEKKPERSEQMKDAENPKESDKMNDSDTLKDSKNLKNSPNQKSSGNLTDNHNLNVENTNKTSTPLDLDHDKNVTTNATATGDSKKEDSPDHLKGAAELKDSNNVTNSDSLKDLEATKKVENGSAVPSMTVEKGDGGGHLMTMKKLLAVSIEAAKKGGAEVKKAWEQVA